MNTINSVGSRNRMIDLLVLAAYVVLSLAMTWPLARQIDTHLAGHYRHARVFQWNNWWVKQALLNGEDPNTTRYLFYPSGVSLVSHNINWASSLLSIPLDALFGQTVAYNLLFLLTFWLSGFGMYLLVLHLTGRRDAAFLAGLIYAFFPYHVSGNWDGQMKLANIQWLPLFVLFLLRTVERQRVWDALLAGLFLALASLDCWFFALFIGMWGLLWLAYSLVFERHKWHWKTVGLLALAGAVSLPLMVPFLGPVVAGSTQGALDYTLTYYADVKSSDLLAFLLPSSAHPLWGALVASLYDRLHHWRPATLGYVALALALYAAIARFRRSLFWLLSGLFFAALAAGTTLTVNGVQYPDVPTLYGALIRLFPALRIVRQASRFNVMVALSLAVLAGIGWADLMERLERRLRTGTRAPGARATRARGAWAGWGATATATAVAAALVLFEYLALPCPLTPAEMSPVYAQLAQEEGDFAILELPLDDYYARESMYPQTVHGKPLLRGHLARMSPEAFAYIESDPILKSVYIQMAPDPATHDVERELGLLAANGIRYVVIHKTEAPDHPALDEGVLASWRELFGPEAYYEDEDMVVYRLDPGQNVASTPVLQLGEELALSEVRVRRTWVIPPDAESAAGVCVSCAASTVREGWLTVDLTWTALGDLERDDAVRLTLLAPGGVPSADGESVLISPRYPTSRWPEGVVIADQVALPIHPALPGGAYRLVIEVTDGVTGAPVAMGEVPVEVADQAQPLVPALAEMQNRAGVNYGNEMRLLGDSTHWEDERLHVALYWQALEAMETPYKVFVHLLDREGQIVAQYDAMPRHWSYPTTRWGRGEVYVERITLDVPGAEPGAYRLAVGVYDPDAGRLVAVDRDGQRLPDDQALLGVLPKAGKELGN